MERPLTQEGIRDARIAQDFYDRLVSEDLTFHEALTILETVSDNLTADMRHRHINGLE